MFLCSIKVFFNSPQIDIISTISESLVCLFWYDMVPLCEFWTAVFNNWEWFLSGIVPSSVKTVHKLVDAYNTLSRVSICVHFLLSVLSSLTVLSLCSSCRVLAVQSKYAFCLGECIFLIVSYGGLSGTSVCNLRPIRSSDFSLSNGAVLYGSSASKYHHHWHVAFWEEFSLFVPPFHLGCWPEESQPCAKSRLANWSLLSVISVCGIPCLAFPNPKWLL